MRIAIVAHGRFHAFDLARALLARGEDVAVFTNYPRWAVEKFGVPGHRVHSFSAHGMLTRLASRLTTSSTAPTGETLLHTMFGRWAARTVGTDFDVVHCWSGVSEELLTRRPERALTLLMRGSAHIETQMALLEAEASRAGTAVDGPTTWMRGREQREYAAADHIVVLSAFARQSFLDHGISPERVSVVPLGVSVSQFRPSAAVLEARRARLLGGAPLRVLYVGAISRQKGIADLLAAARAMEADETRFTLVGPMTAEGAALVRDCRGHVSIEGKRPQHELPRFYWEADVFLFPTLQDGFGMVLTQAKAAGLPLIATTNSAAPDLIAEGEDGWVIPVRSPQSIVERLRWCASHRRELADMTDRIAARYRPDDWSDVATSFVELVQRLQTSSHSVANG